MKNSQQTVYNGQINVCKSCRRATCKTGLPCKYPVMPQSSWETGLRNQPSSSAGTQGRLGKLHTWPSGFLQHLSTFLKAECDPCALAGERGHIFLPFHSLQLIVNCKANPLGSLWSITKYTNTIPSMSHSFKHSHGS